MSKLKNIFSWFFKFLLVFTFLAAIVVVFTPKLINLEMVKRNIKDRISNDVGGQLTYRNLKLSYFPRPHVVIQKAKISIPDSFTIDIQWMRIYPKILPLFAGSLEFAVVRLDYADYFMKLPQIKEAESKQPERAPTFDETVRTLTEAVRSLPEFKLPDVNLRLKNGRVNLIDPFGRLTGTLASGESIDNVFHQGGGDYTGTIQLIPEPSTALLLASGLLGLSTVRRRQNRF